MPHIRWTVCPDCREVHEGTGRCADCRRAADQRRPTSRERGYNNEHRKLRRTLARGVAAGTAVCWRCRRPIDPDEPWDLGHDDTDRERYRGPEHAACNRATSGRERAF